MDDEMISYLKCDVELEISARDSAALNKRAAEALRKAADLVESGELEDGFIAVTDSTGKKVGEIYVDYSESDDEGTPN